MKTVTCLLCFRTVQADDGGRMVPHCHTPMMASQCDGGGKTPEESKAHGVESLRKWREQHRAKQAAGGN